MTIKYGILNYDEPKAMKAKLETPTKLYEFNAHEASDLKSDAADLADKIVSLGKDHFRLYVEGNGKKSLYQVNLNRDSREFFEREIYDDLTSIYGIKSYFG